MTMSMLLGRLFVATVAGWLIYSCVTRNAPFTASQSAGVFATQLLGSVLGAIAFAWLFAPLNGIAINDLSLQLTVRVSGMLLCAAPVVLLWLCMRAVLRRQRWR